MIKLSTELEKGQGANEILLSEIHRISFVFGFQNIYGGRFRANPRHG